jgi:hypothetical protein
MCRDTVHLKAEKLLSSKADWILEKGAYVRFYFIFHFTFYFLDVLLIYFPFYFLFPGCTL